MAHVKCELDRCGVTSLAMPAKTGYRIGFFRTRAGLSQGELGAATGRSAKMIGRYESGEIEPPAHVLIRMAVTLGTTVDELLNVPARLPSEIDLNGRRYIEVASDASKSHDAQGEPDPESGGVASARAGEKGAKKRRPRGGDPSRGG